MTVSVWDVVFQCRSVYLGRYWLAWFPQCMTAQLCRRGINVYVSRFYYICPAMPRGGSPNVKVY